MGLWRTAIGSALNVFWFKNLWLKTFSFIASLLVALAIGSSCSASASVDPGQFRFFHTDERDGLSQSSVTAITQDSKGFIWLGTQDGLNRYDGYKFEIFRYQHNNLDSLPTSFITALETDRDDHLWIGTFSGGLARLDLKTQRFKRYGDFIAAAAGRLRINAIFRDSNNRILVGTDQGLHCYNPATDAFSPLLEASADSTALDSAKEKHTAAESRGVKTVVRAIAPLGKSLWVAVYGNLYRIAAARGCEKVNWADIENTKISFPSEISALGVDRGGTLWIGTAHSGLFSYHPGTASRRHFSAEPQESVDMDNSGLRNNAVRSILVDRENRIWVGTQRGLHLYHRQLDSFSVFLRDPDNRYSIGSNMVESIYQDRSGLLWFGSWNSGFDRLDLQSLQFRQITLDEQGGTTGMYEDESGRLWVGTFNGLLRIGVDGSRKVFRFPASQSNANLKNAFSSISRIDGGRRFLLGSRDGVAVFDTVTETFTHLGQEGEIIINTMVDARNRLWLGTWAEGPIVLDIASGSVIKRFDYKPVPTFYVTHGLTSRNLVWVGGGDGLHAYDFATLEEVAHLYYQPDNPVSISHNMVTALLQTDQQTLWLGTQGGGLNRLVFKGANLERPEVKVFTAKNGLSSDAVGAVLADQLGYLWISTTQGINRYDPASGKFVTYDDSDGASAGSYYISGYFQNNRGTIYMSGPHGITVFDPGTQHPKYFNPHVVITGLRVFNDSVHPGAPGEESILDRSIHYADSLNLHHRHSVFSLDFAALEYAASSRLKYEYRLQGFDSDWNRVNDDRRTATYTNLRPGKYLFQVRATDKTGNWSGHELSLPINIIPPWWLTWQTKVAFVLLFCAVIYLGYRVRSWQIHVYAKRLEREVEDRTHLLREYNQQLKVTARTDYLTGLPNRRYFLEEAERHYASLLRTQRKFSVLLMDVDHFKSINDQWGHEGGDYVLVELASRLCSTCRQMDLIARWGGEEFIMLFPESDIRACLAAVEKVKRSIITRPFHYKGNHFYITVTIGIAEVSAGVALEQSINDADEALYRGKKNGRNCIRYAQQ